MTVGERIKYLRLQEGKTLSEVGKAIGVSKQTVSKYELGIVKNIPFKRIEKLAEYLNCSPLYLMNWENWE